ncbi:MAG: NAD(P)H-dependent oxidoreductase [Acidimicrobiales bacterium]
MSSTSPPHILLVSGSLRSQSTNTALLRTAHAVAPARIVTVLYDELGELPHFNPDDDVEAVDEIDPAVARLRAAIHAADGVLFCTPEYAGALPGSFKNLLDWTIGDNHVRSMYRKPVAWIVASLRGAENAYHSLRTVLGYAHSYVIEAACIQIAVTSSMIGDDGLIDDVSVRDLLVDALTAFASGVEAAPDPEQAN